MHYIISGFFATLNPSALGCKRYSRGNRGGSSVTHAQDSKVGRVLLEREIIGKHLAADLSLCRL